MVMYKWITNELLLLSSVTCLYMSWISIWDTLQSETQSVISTDTSLLYEAPDDVSLYVYESVELELSLTTTSLKTEEFIEDTFTCPIKIIKGNQWHMDISCFYVVIFTPLLIKNCVFFTVFAQLKRDFK